MKRQILMALERWETANGPPLDRVADGFGWTAGHFTRVCQALLGQTPRDWRSARRLSRAQGLLRRSSNPLRELAAQLGFVDAYHFSKFFKAHAGVSPGAWRRAQES